MKRTVKKYSKTFLFQISCLNVTINFFVKNLYYDLK